MCNPLERRRVSLGNAMLAKVHVCGLTNISVCLIIFGNTSKFCYMYYILSLALKMLLFVIWLLSHLSSHSMLFKLQSWRLLGPEATLRPTYLCVRWALGHKSPFPSSRQWSSPRSKPLCKNFPLPPPILPPKTFLFFFFPFHLQCSMSISQIAYFLSPIVIMCWVWLLFWTGFLRGGTALGVFCPVTTLEEALPRCLVT